jgi:hypothetical protein
MFRASKPLNLNFRGISKQLTLFKRHALIRYLL